MFSTPAGLSNMSSQGGQYLVIHWEKITRSPCGNQRSSKTPSNTLSGLSPSILCILAPSYAFLTLPGCLKWTILPQKALLFFYFFVKFVFFLKFQFSDFIFDILIKYILLDIWHFFPNNWWKYQKPSFSVPVKCNFAGKITQFVSNYTLIVKLHTV